MRDIRAGCNPRPGPARSLSAVFPATKSESFPRMNSRKGPPALVQPLSPRAFPPPAAEFEYRVENIVPRRTGCVSQVVIDRHIGIDQNFFSGGNMRLDI